MLKIRLLGGFRVDYEGTPLTGWESFKIEALFAYLVLHPREAFRRPHLAGLFWPEKPDPKALASLRHALHVLRRVVPAFERYMYADRVQIGFDPQAPYWLDVEEFTRLLGKGLDPEPAEARGGATLQELAHAVRLYRGPFLQGHPAHEVDEWEWVAHARESLKELQMQALERLAEGHAARGEHAQAVVYGRRLLRLQPYREELYRRLMRYLAAQGDAQEASRVYAACVRALGELGLAPTPPTQELWQEITQRPPPPRRARAPADPQGPEGPVSSPSPVRIRLRPLTPLIGRRREVAQALALLGAGEEGGSGRLLTLVGPGGIGKSRLALEIAARSSRRYADGVRFLPLDGVSDPALLEDALARGLALSPPGHPQEIRAQLVQYLQGKELLLALDGFEHLITRADFLVDLLREAPRLRILVTSRERLHLLEERVLLVKGLRLAGGDEASLEGSDAEAEADAVRLFLYHAGRVAPDFRLVREERPYVHKICDFLEGLPLGIELAAAWAHLLRPPQIWEGIRSSLRFLEGAAADLPPNPTLHAQGGGLRAVFEHSWNLLAPEERAVLPRLAVFRGGFTREAAEQVAQASPTVLAGLVDKCLLQRDPTGRFRLPKVVRGYAEEKLGTVPGEAERTAERHGLYHLDLLRRWGEASRGGGTPAVWEAMEAEIENVWAGWEWAVSRRRIDELAAALDGLTEYCFLRSRFREGERICVQTLRHLRPHAITEQGRRGEMKRISNRQELLLVRLRVRQGIFLERRTRYRRARRVLERALKLLERMASRKLPSPSARALRREEALALQSYGIVLHMTGEPARGLRALKEALRKAQAAQDVRLRAHLLRDLAVVAQARGDYAEARDRAEESVRLFQEVGSEEGMAAALSTLSRISMSLGELEAARRQICRALPSLRRTGSRWMAGLAYLNLGEIHRLEGRLARAERCARHGAAIFEETDSSWGRTIASLGLGEVALSRGKLREAAQHFRQAEEVAAKADLLTERVRALCGLSRVSLAQGSKGDTAARAQGYLREAVGALRTWGGSPKKGDRGMPVLLPAEVLVEVAALWIREERVPEAAGILEYVLREFPLCAQLRRRAEELRAQLPGLSPSPSPSLPEAVASRRPRPAGVLAWVEGRLPAPEQGAGVRVAADQSMR